MVGPSRTAKPHRRRLSIGTDGSRLIAGLLLIVVILFGQQVYGMITAHHRLDPSLQARHRPQQRCRRARLQARAFP